MPGEIEDFSKFRTEFGQAVHFMAVSDSPDQISSLVDTPKYKAMSNDTVNPINVCTDLKIELNQKGGTVDMCNGVKMLIANGQIQTRIEDILDLLSDIGEIPAKLEEQIQSQKDPATLKRWFKLAARCDSLEDFMNQM